MNKYYKALFLTLLLCNAHAGIYKWMTYDDLGNNDPGHDLYSVAASWLGPKAGKEGWIACIYEADNARYSDSNWFSHVRFNNNGIEFHYNDQLIHSAYVKDDGGWLWIDEAGINLNLGHYYTVLFDSTSIATATDFVVLQSSTFEALIAGDTFAGTYTTFEGEETSGLAWNIPEPSTCSSLVLGTIILFLSRKRMRR